MYKVKVEYLLFIDTEVHCQSETGGRGCGWGWEQKGVLIAYTYAILLCLVILLRKNKFIDLGVKMGMYLKVSSVHFVYSRRKPRQIR